MTMRLAFLIQFRRRVIGCLILLALALPMGDGIALEGNLQVPALDFEHENPTPAYTGSDGPKVVIHARNSPFAADGGLDGFEKILRADGFSPSKHQFAIDGSLLDSMDVLVVANVYSSAYRRRSVLDPPSVYSDREIDLIEKWVSAGGRLLVLADHSPLGDGSKKLVEAFGFTQMSGYVIRDQNQLGDENLHILFSPDNGLNSDHAITNGGTGRPEISQFMTFGGQALLGPAESTQLLTIPQGYVSLLTYDLQSELSRATRINSAGLSMGSVLTYGQGRVAIFGETGGFTSQIFDRTKKMGFVHPEGKGNPEFVLSVMRWLVGFEP